MKPVKWGIISTANIGVAKVLPGMLKSKDVEIVAISSRKLKTAQGWAGHWHTDWPSSNKAAHPKVRQRLPCLRC